MTTLSILSLLVINAFFVAAEFALVKVPTFRIQALAAEGSVLAELTLGIKQNLEPYLAACQLGITMASLGLGWIGEPAVATLLQPVFHGMGLPDNQIHIISFLIGFILFSSLHIVVGEQVPKTYAIRTSEKVAMWSAPLLIAFYWMAFPINWLLNRASRAILRLLGVKEVSHVEIMTGSEISGQIDIAKDHGEIAEDQAQMLQNLFKFDERVVHSIMIPRSKIEVLDINCSTEEVLEQIRDSHHSRLPVINGDWGKLEGVVFAKDLLLAYVDNANINVGEHLRPPQLVPESQAIRILFDRMRGNREHMAFAVDEFGQIDGMVTLEDLVEELVGEIDDETDDESGIARIEKVADGWIASGFYAMHDLISVTGFIPESLVSASTMSGFMMQRLQKVPESDDVWHESDFSFSVTAMEGAHIESVHIRKVDDVVAEVIKNEEPDTQ